MTPDIPGRLIIVETKLQNLSEAYAEEKEETRRYRETLQDEVKSLQRMVFVGTGILIALQFVAPFIVNALNK